MNAIQALEHIITLVEVTPTLRTVAALSLRISLITIIVKIVAGINRTKDQTTATKNLVASSLPEATFRTSSR
jgi:hypothetical protein